MDFPLQLGMNPSDGSSLLDEANLREYALLKLYARGYDFSQATASSGLFQLAGTLLQSLQEKNRLLADHLCPGDQRIQDFITRYLSPLPEPPSIRLPASCLILDRHGLARVLSLPRQGDSFSSSIIQSHRAANGILHNPDKDRRTTKGVFHVAEGGLPIPADKKEVPLPAFARLLSAALAPPPELMILPFTSAETDPARIFVSLLLKPKVSPAVPEVSGHRRLEVRFFAPGSMVCNLDFVESIFGNGGDPYLSENDLALNAGVWSGHTGCVILAPHLTTLRKRDLGLPERSQATPRQIRDGMCWTDPEELYNEGTAFKVTARDKSGVVVTLIADNYFGYCKKEVKTQISYSANLMGGVEEEHAGGALAFPSYDLGEDFQLSSYIPVVDHNYTEALQLLGSKAKPMPEGYAVDTFYPDIYYVPEDVRISLHKQTLSWKCPEGVRSIHLQPNITYVLPSGYKVEMVQPSKGRRWRLIGTTAEGLFCHKPCTVSGGGKSEISKPLTDAMLLGPVFVADFTHDFAQVEEIIGREYGQRFCDPSRNRDRGRPFLSPQRSLGSVIKLLSPSSEYTGEYNRWLENIPQHVKDIVFTIKRLHKPDWGDGWKERFSVDTINGRPGNELKYRDNKLQSQYLRVGFAEDGSWRTFSLRKDFHPSRKIQTEDDISVSRILPSGLVPNLPSGMGGGPSVKLVENCEYRLFQRPDDAILRGYDDTTEADFSKGCNFFSNYMPVTREKAAEVIRDTIRFSQFTVPMQNLLRDFVAAESPGFVVSTAHVREVDGIPTKNPRYLQNRPDLQDPRSTYLAQTGAKLYRRVSAETNIPFPVGAVLPGRRNNPPDKAAGHRPLAVYNPIHFQELPELFMDFIASLTGRSPSTTGAGSEGALTKGPFNALCPITDLNSALVSYLLTGLHAFSTAAGYIGPKYRVDHDISLLIPELWCRMSPREREPEYLIKNGFLEKMDDFSYGDRTILASRLGYRITAKFASTFGGRIFSSPASVFTADMLAPELQDLESFVDGIENITSTQQRVAQLYFEDGSIEAACPPLTALLNIMAHGTWNGCTAGSPEVRRLFTLDSHLSSDWYRARLETQKEVDLDLLEVQEKALSDFLERRSHSGVAGRLSIQQRLDSVRQEKKLCLHRDYPGSMQGFLGRDPNLSWPLPKES